MIEKFKQYSGRLPSIFLILIGFVIPIYIKIIPVLIIMFAIFNLIDAILHKAFILSNKRIAILGIIFFLIHLISVGYSQNKPVAWFDIEVKLSLLVFPLLFLFRNQKIKNNLKNVLFAFSVGTIISSIILLTVAFYKYYSKGIFAFNYIALSEGLNIHPSYLSMYYIFSIGIILKFFISKYFPIKRQILPILLVLFLFVLIFLLQSKAGIISLIIISFYLFVISLIKLKSVLLKVTFGLLILSTTTILFQKSSRLSSMFHSVEKISLKDNHDESTTGVRISIWKITIDEIKQHWIIGVGAGDIKTILFKKYKENSINRALDNKYNVHNQFLETFLGQGIIGFSLLLALFYFGFREANRRKNWLLTVFLILTIFSFGPESMLNNQAGVIFFAFFYFFLFQYTSEEDIIAS